MRRQVCRAGRRVLLRWRWLRWRSGLRWIRCGWRGCPLWPGSRRGCSSMRRRRDRSRWRGGSAGWHWRVGRVRRRVRRGGGGLHRSPGGCGWLPGGGGVQSAVLRGSLPGWLAAGGSRSGWGCGAGLRDSIPLLYRGVSSARRSWRAVGRSERWRARTCGEPSGSLMAVPPTRAAASKCSAVGRSSLLRSARS